MHASVIIGCGMRVHSALGPGLLESAYEACLCRALAVPLSYDGLHLDCGFRADLVVESKAMLTYLKITGTPLGLIINFNVAHLRDGIRRRVFTT